MNGYVEKDGQKYLWVGKRSEVKPTYPGMLDHLVAGGLVNTDFYFVLGSYHSCITYEPEHGKYFVCWGHLYAELPIVF